MNKLQAFLRLKGITKEDNSLIQREKFRYAYNRFIRFFRASMPIFTMGVDLKKSVIADTGQGLFFCREKSADLHIISGSYEFKTVNLFRELAKQSKMIVDVGANIGKYSISMGLINSDSKIIAIEPENDNFAILKRNIELNKLSNINPLKIALGSKKQRKKLYTNKINFGGHSLINKSESFEDIEVDRLDNLFDSIDLIKIDTEGYEMEILKGAENLLSGKKIKKIIVEIDEQNLSSVQKLFEKYGYSLKQIQYNNYLATF